MLSLNEWIPLFLSLPNNDKFSGIRGVICIKPVFINNMRVPRIQIKGGIKGVGIRDKDINEKK